MVKNGELLFDDLVDMGCIEYLDVNEMNNALIAIYEHEVKSSTTHLEVLIYIQLIDFCHIFVCCNRLSRSRYWEFALDLYRIRTIIKVLGTRTNVPWVSRQWVQSATTSRNASTH